MYHTLISVHRIRQSGQPEYLAAIFRRTSRQVVGGIIVENNRRVVVRNSFTFRASVQWNKLPMELRVVVKISKFKLKLRRWVAEQVPRFLT